VESVDERMQWLEATGISASMVGVSPARIFGDFTDEEALRFFGSDHLNDNGAIYFTAVVTPALIEVFTEHARVN
jgi:hypothetical protein